MALNLPSQGLWQFAVKADGSLEYIYKPVFCGDAEVDLQARLLSQLMVQSLHEN